MRRMCVWVLVIVFFMVRVDWEFVSVLDVCIGLCSGGLFIVVSINFSSCVYVRLFMCF